MISYKVYRCVADQCTACMLLPVFDDLGDIGPILNKDDIEAGWSNRGGHLTCPEHKHLHKHIIEQRNDWFERRKQAVAEWEANNPMPQFPTAEGEGE